MDKNKPAKKSNLPNILYIVLVIIFYNFFISEEIKKFFSSREEIQQTSNELKSYSDSEENRVKIDLAKNEIEKLKKAFVTRNDTKDLLQFLAKAATDTNVNLISITSRPENKKSFYAEVPFEINFSGDYKKVVEYLNKIENYSKKIDIYSINIDTEKRVPNLEITVLLVVYMLNK